jgi:hypothetical protein
MVAPRHGLEWQAGMSGVVLVAAASLAVLSLLAFAVSFVALSEIRQGQGPERDRGRKRR